MDYTYVKDENGKITDILVNGKPIERASMRGFRKAQKCSYFKLISENENYVRGEILNGLQATVYLFTQLWEKRYNRYLMAGDFDNLKKFTEAPVETFDDMRLFFRQLDSGLYMALLD